MKKDNPQLYSIREAIKELGRYMISIGMVDSAIVITQMIMAGINSQTGEISIDWQHIMAFTLFSVFGGIVRALDKYKHEYSKATTPTLEAQGTSMGVLPF